MPPALCKPAQLPLTSSPTDARPAGLSAFGHAIRPRRMPPVPFLSQDWGVTI